MLESLNITRTPSSGHSASTNLSSIRHALLILRLHCTDKVPGGNHGFTSPVVAVELVWPALLGDGLGFCDQLS